MKLCGTVLGSHMQSSGLVPRTIEKKKKEKKQTEKIVIV
jgi:hypothetical protein